MPGEEATLCALVERYLTLHLHANALFLAERLFATAPSEVNRHLLATCLIYDNQLARAVSVLEDSKAPANRYLLARYCLKLGRLPQAEAALLKGTGLEGRPVSTYRDQLLANPDAIPNGAAGLHLLGLIAKAGSRRQQAVQFFQMAAAVDPFMWVSFEELCKLGCDPDAGQQFAVHDAAGVDVPTSTPLVMRRFSLGSTSGAPHMATATPAPPLGLSLAGTPSPITPAMRLQLASPPPSSFVTPTGSVTETPAHAGVAVLPSAGLPAAPDRRRAGTRPNPSPATQTPAFGGTAPTGGLPPSSAKAAAPNRRPSRRRRRSETEDDDVDDGGGGSMGPPVVPTVTEPPAAGDQGVPAVLGLLQVLGTALRHLSMFRCQEALDTVAMLPAHQYNTGWVLTLVGRAHFEMANYRASVKAFQELRRVAPGQLHGLAVYSTALWHLKQDAQLSFLAHQAVELDRFNPETWCIVGNCFSLQKEHETALEFLKRAIQVDPTFTYAYSLCGHELVANGDLDKATSFYRLALKQDPRHYTAWFGLGSIYYRQEKTGLAEYHFRRALAINPRSSVLHCYLGMVLLTNDKHDEALMMLEEAARLEPLNPQSRYQKANVYMAMDRFEDAFEELQIVRRKAPREASVYLMLGRVCKKLHRLTDAVKFFNMALEFDPKNANQIKAALAKLDVDDDLADEPEL